MQASPGQHGDLGAAATGHLECDVRKGARLVGLEESFDDLDGLEVLRQDPVDVGRVHAKRSRFDSIRHGLRLG